MGPAVMVRNTSSFIFMDAMGHNEVIDALEWSPDGAHLVACWSTKQECCLWSVAAADSIDQGAKLKPLWCMAVVKPVAWSPDGTKLAVGGTNAASGAAPSNLADHQPHEDNSIHILSVSTNGWTTCQDETGGCHFMTALLGHTATVSCLAWSVDGRQLVSGSRDKSVIIWTETTRSLVV